MIIVVGSGATGVAATLALIKRGKEVLLLDAGYTGTENSSGGNDNLLPRDEEEYLQLLHNSLPSIVDNGLFPQKLFPHNSFSYSPILSPEGIEIPAARAKGGLTRIWGGAILPAHPRDLRDWPLGYDELKPYYEEVLKVMKVSATLDPLLDHFPLLTNPLYPLPLAPRLVSLMERMNRYRNPLETQGIFFGQSRLAMQFPHSQEDCTLCGFCFFGCPYELIFTTATILKDLITKGALAYCGGVNVQRIEESGSRVILYGVKEKDGTPMRWEAERVYLACGVIETATILMRSLPRSFPRVQLLSSHMFLIPWLPFFSFRVEKERSHSLAQMFIELLGACPCEHTVHLQLYEPTEPMRLLIQYGAKRHFPWIPPFLLRWGSERALFLLGFLHSHHSHRFWLEFSEKERLSVKVERNPDVKRVILRVMKRLWRNPQIFSGILFPLRELTPLGRGMHFGGSFPMQRSPRGCASDLMGRPLGFTRVHIVDTSVLPTLPATTITLTAMANAYRIASVDF